MENINQLYFHCILIVENNERSICPTWHDNLFKYVNTVLKYHGHEPITVNAHYDHMHLLFRMSPEMSIDNLMRIVKRCTTVYAATIPDRATLTWSEEYVCVSCSRTELDLVARSINKQETYHSNKALREEIEDLLDRMESDIPIEHLMACQFWYGPLDYSPN